MKIVVVGASGLIGAKTVERLSRKGHDVVPASRSSGVNTVTGEGLADALRGADVVLDVSNSPSFEDKAVMEFFEKSTGNLLAAEVAAGVKHHISLGVVGTEDLQDSGYFRAKLTQENLIRAGAIPYTIVHATQFFEFIGAIADAATVDEQSHLSTAFMQPIAANDVADVMAATCSDEPINGIVEIAGPERLRQSEVVEKYFNAKSDKRKIVATADAPYYGVKLKEESLVPHGSGKLSPTSFDEWMKSVTVFLIALLVSSCILPAKAVDDNAKVTVVYDHVLPNVPGKSIKGILVEYGPGGFSPAHTHAKSAFIYATVLEGEITSQVNNESRKTYKAGESFSEMPGDIHAVSENASKTKPARLLAVFVVDSDEKDLTTPLK